MITTLIVLGEEDCRGQVRALLEKMGCKVRAVSTGEEAQSFCRANSIDLLIADSTLPDGVAGLELAQVVRDGNPETAQILITGIERKSRRQERVDLGPYYYLKRPFRLEALRACVQDLMVQHRSAVLRLRGSEIDLEDAKGSSACELHEVDDLWFAIFSKLGRFPRGHR